MKNRVLRYLSLPALLLCLMHCRPMLACKCLMSLSACNEVSQSDVVFIGTVESIEPNFLNYWNLASPAALQSLNDAFLEVQKQPSEANLTRLKETYLKTFPEVVGDEQGSVKGAKTALDVSSLFYLALNRGMRVRFHVKTLFKHEDDDDDDKDKDKRKKADDKQDDDDQVLDVWNPFGDCGYNFQTGETYLVYANTEESSDYMFTGSCTRTRRLSDAGDDLAYLFFYKQDRERSSRLEGFTTTDVQAQFDFDPLRQPRSIRSPVTDVVVELRADGLRRYAQPDTSGKFYFDGLAGGDYQVSAFAAGYPENRELLAGPQASSGSKKSQLCKSDSRVAPLMLKDWKRMSLPRRKDARGWLLHFGVRCLALAALMGIFYLDRSPLPDS